jgi:retinol dehydrogenase-12
MPNPLTFLYNSLYTQMYLAPSPPTSFFTGQTIIVTGGNTGLGLASISHFINLNASRVILTSRDTRKGEDALTRIAKATGKTGVVEVWQLDLSSARSVNAFCKRAEEELQRVDVLMCNAGSATEKFCRVGDEVEKGDEGMETVLATNVVGTMRLVLGMLPVMRAKADVMGTTLSRVCIVSSDLHFISAFEQRNSEKILVTLNRQDGVGSMFERYVLARLLRL